MLAWTDASLWFKHPVVSKMWALWEDVICDWKKICDWNMCLHVAPLVHLPRESGHLDNFSPLVYSVKWTPKIWYCLYGIIIVLLDKSHHTLSRSALHLVDSYIRFKGLRLANSWLLTLWCKYKSLLSPFWVPEQIKTETHRIVKR